MNLPGRSLKTGVSGDDVRALHEELARLNVVIPANESRSGRFGAGTAAAVKRFQKERGLRATGIVDAATVNAINASAGGAQPTTFTVSGRVYSALRAGVGGLRVAAVDKNAGPDVPLAEAVTAEGGRYSIQYSSAAVSRQGKTAPDLQVRAFAGDTLVAASEVRYNASASETLDIVVPDASATALHAELETLTSAIAVHFKGNLADLQETASPGEPEQRSDITYLANKTGWDARAVALAALADQFSRRSGANAPIAPAFFYALFRAGLPANEDSLYSLDAASLTKIWTAAAAQGVIPPSATAQIPKVAKLFQAASAKRLLTAPALAGVSSIKDMLSSVSKLSAPQTQQFADLYAANRNDMPAFWTAVTAAFGGETAARLQLDGKLAYLTLNNAPLMQALKQSGGQQQLTDPVDLALAGYHRADKWKPLLTANTAVPAEIAGATPEAKVENYAAYLAAQVRLSYPTASVAEMVKVGTLPVRLPDQVTRFLTAQQDKFAIGAEPIQRYVARTGTTVSDGVVAEVKRIERLYQVTPSDLAMSVLLKRGIDSAYHIAQQDRETFIQSLAADLGADQAAAVYARSIQVQNAVLNIAVGYVTARNGVNLGAAPFAAADGQGTPAGQILRPAPTGSAAANPDVIAYPTLEKLFGSMDYCACDHCRSVLSPAAYLVDLLQFIDKEPPPPGPSETPKLNPQAVLFARRPDIQHLPLTCENTNTALPYIDIVNEALEYYVANAGPQPSLDGYQGHDTGAAASEDLMASPRYVMDTAYDILRGELFPPPLPFNQPLETLRLHFEKLEVPLALAMERLRKTDDVERGANPYGWRDILMEELGLSREEYRLLTDGSLSLAAIWGFPPGGTDDETIEAFSNAKLFCRRIGISYEDLVAILRSRFVNPNSDLIPKLQRLGVPFATLRDLHDGSITDGAFDALLPQGVAAPVAAEYGGDIKAWVKDPENFARIMSIIVLAGPAETAGECDFGTFELRYSKPAGSPPDNRLGVVDFVRLLRFIRLWRKLGWSIDHVDAAICALFRGDLAPVTATDLAAVPDLDAGFRALLPRLGEAVRAMRALGVTPAAELHALLACWSNIGTHGEGSLYGRLFLNQAIVDHDPAFADDGYGNVPAGSDDPLASHAESLRAALTLTAEELALIAETLGFDVNTKLTLGNITAVYRRGWLARKLRVSVRELLLLSSLTGLDPFAPPDPPAPAISRFIALVQSMKARSLRLSSALYLMWNRDPSGKAAPTAAKVDQFARNLRAELAAIDDQFALVEDPGGDVARARLALVYGPETADTFFGLADDAVVLNVDGYTHPSSELEPGIVAVDDRLAYDNFQHRLSHVGLLTATTRDALKAVAGVSATFGAAVDALFARGEDLTGAFFARFPELRAAYDAYAASTAPSDERRAALLAAFSPELAKRRKAHQALQSLATAASVDAALAEALLDPAEGPSPLHAAGDPSRAGIHDVAAIGTPGLAAAFFFADTATGAVDEEVAAAASLSYSPAANPLPANPSPGDPISGIWRGRIEAPETGYFNIVVEAEPAATVILTLDGQPQALLQSGTVWRNSAALQLKAGVLYAVELTVNRIREALSIKWETPKRSREVIPGRYLYPAGVLAPFHAGYVRFLKVAALTSALRLSANEIVTFANDPSLKVAGDGWLNALPVVDSPPAAVAAGLLGPLERLLELARLKSELSPDDERVLEVLKNPAAATTGADGLFYALLGGDRPSLEALLTQFGATIGGLQNFDLFRRVCDAFAILGKIGVGAAAAIRATTNAPDAAVVRDFGSALRARFEVGSWRELIQPLNDRLRSMQRDALVAHILHRMSGAPATASIDTPDKLFEYFLMDVQMEPCMQTSRIRHALSTVQLFIERCAMNLEVDVSPSSINSKQWAWMKRYRVWEANRKVFLYPENWIEPELRDDKSPFFKEIESQLLQSDITEEAATSAYLTYLSRLEEVAKLEPCGLHYVEPTTTPFEPAVMHVVARTAGAKRKYYYRRFDHGTWTAWDPIKLDIPDKPVVPVVWQDRLLLFWLRLMKKNPDGVQRPAGNKALTELRTEDIPHDHTTKLQAVLCWSEYYDGKWQAEKTSDINAPADLDEGRLTSLLTPERIRSVIRAKEAPLRIDLSEWSFFSFDPVARPVTFLVHNTHSLPEIEYPATAQPLANGRILGPDIVYVDANENATVRRVLTAGGAYHVAEPTHELADTWNAPFFYEDRHHAFLVTSDHQPVWIKDFGNYGVFVNPNLVDSAMMRPLILPPPPSPSGGVRVTEDAFVDKGLSTATAVTFNGRRIGPTGAKGETS